MTPCIDERMGTMEERIPEMYNIIKERPDPADKWLPTVPPDDRYGYDKEVDLANYYGKIGTTGLHPCPIISGSIEGGDAIRIECE